MYKAEDLEKLNTEYEKLGKEPNKFVDHPSHYGGESDTY